MEIRGKKTRMMTDGHYLFTYTYEWSCISRVCVDNNSWLEITYTHDHTIKTFSHNPCVNNNEISSLTADNSTQTGR